MTVLAVKCGKQLDLQLTFFFFSILRGKIKKMIMSNFLLKYTLFNKVSSSVDPEVSFTVSCLVHNSVGVKPQLNSGADQTS